MPDIVCSDQSGMSLILLAWVNGIVQIRHVDGSQSGYIREAVISNGEESQIVVAKVEGAVGVELVLLPMLKPIEKAIAVRGLQRDPRMRVRSRTPAGHKIEVPVISRKSDERLQL